VLHEASGVKVKELVVEPKQKLSMQRHRYRSEHWHVAEGTAVAFVNNTAHLLELHDTVEIAVNAWHCLSNPTDKQLRIIEIQYGTLCDEDDIERLETALPTLA
jgi:mannose-6-phosphate isomerase-like protein (cupin superfamily)